MELHLERLELLSGLLVDTASDVAAGTRPQRLDRVVDTVLGAIPLDQPSAVPPCRQAFRDNRGGPERTRQVLGRVAFECDQRFQVTPGQLIGAVQPNGDREPVQPVRAGMPVAGPVQLNLEPVHVVLDDRQPRQRSLVHLEPCLQSHRRCGNLLSGSALERSQPRPHLTYGPFVRGLMRLDVGDLSLKGSQAN
jgi:hypothetical protein